MVYLKKLTICFYLDNCKSKKNKNEILKEYNIEC